LRFQVRNTYNSSFSLYAGKKSHAKTRRREESNKAFLRAVASLRELALFKDSRS
jgi:hypothetical protein